jgi:hypothetical protein
LACLRKSFQLLLLLRPKVSSLSFYVPPLKPAILVTVPAMSTVDHGESSIENAYISGATPLELTASVCFSLVALEPFLCKAPIPSIRPKLCMSQRLLRITLSPVNKTPRV